MVRQNYSESSGNPCVRCATTLGWKLRIKNQNKNKISLQGSHPLVCSRWKQHQTSAIHLTPIKPAPWGEDGPRSVPCSLVSSQAWHNTGAPCSPPPTIRAGLWLLPHCWEPFLEVWCVFKCAASLRAGKPSEAALPVTALAQHRGYQPDWLLTGTACIVDTEFKSQPLPHVIQMHQRDAPLSSKH